MKLIALGDNVVDLYRNTGEQFPGGNAVNVAVHAARCGADAEYLGALADDEAAQSIRQALDQSGVRYDRCPVLPGTTTKLCLYDVVEGERSFIEIVTGDTWAGPLQLGDRERQYLAEADLIVSSCNAKMPEQMAAVQALPPIFAFDFGEKEKYRTPEYYDQVGGQMDLAMFSCTAMEPEKFAALCRPLHQRGVVHILATMGSRGQMLSVGGKILQNAVEKINAYDTMGAGDSFLAAFLCDLYEAGWQKGRPMPEPALRHALQAGQQAAARNCMTRGGFGCKADVSVL